MVGKVLFEVIMRLIFEAISQWEQWWPLVPMPF